MAWWWWHSDTTLVTEVVLKAAKTVLSQGELWAAFGGAFVGGWWTRRVAADQMRDERQLSHDNARWATGISAVQEMLDPLETMRDLVDSLGGFDSSNKPVDTEQQGLANTALDIMDRLARTRATLLPPELYNRWFRAARLARQYQNARKQQVALGWSKEKFSRAKDDVYNYMAYVSTSLATFAQTGKVDAECEPPVLRRDDMEPWQPC